MAITYETISSSLLTGTASSVTFSSIPSNYTDLVLSCSMSSSSSVPDLWVRFNGDTGTNYSLNYMFATGGGSLATGRQTSQAQIQGGSIGTTTNTSSFFLDINSYSNTSVNKTVFGRNSVVPDNVYWVFTGVWRSTAVINSIAIINNGSTFTTNSVFTLYGIKAA